MNTALGTVLLTGASGLVGRQTVAPLCRRGYRVITTARHGVDVPVDLLDHASQQALIRAHRPTHLLHLAWETRHGHYWTAAENDAWLAASMNLVRLFVASGGRRVVIAGTCAEYDWSKLAAPSVREDAALASATPYARAKNELHSQLAAAARDQAFSYAWGRIFLVTGPGEHPGRLVPSLVRSLLRGEETRCTSGHQVRDFMDSRDAGEAFAALLANDDVTGPVNIATGEPHSIREAATTLGKFAGRSELLRVGALPDRPGDPSYLVADATRLNREVGFRFRIGFETMLADALRWHSPGHPRP